MAEKTITTKKCTLSLEGAHKFTGTLIYHEKGTYESVKAGVPARGTRSSHFPKEAVLQKADLEPLGGELWQVTLTYYERSAWTGEEISIEKTPANYTLNSISEDRSILLHPNYEAALAQYPGIRGLLERAIKNGVSDMVYPGKLDEKDYIPDESAQKRSIKEIMDAAKAGTEELQALVPLWRKIKDGVKKYKVYRYSLDVTTNESTLRLDKDLGKISDPKGAPKLPWTGGNWLFSGMSTGGNTADGFKVTRTYDSSAAGAAWDKDLYS